MDKTRKSITQTYMFLIKEVKRDKILKNHAKVAVCQSIKAAYKAIMDNRTILSNNKHIPIIINLNKKSEFLVKQVSGLFSYEKQQWRIR